MSNGEAIVVRAAMKPLPTLMRPLGSVDLATGEAGQALVERSDVQAVEALAVVAEAAVAWELARAAREKFGGDALVGFRRGARRVPGAHPLAALNALDRHLALVGFMGAGKTTLGPELAARLGREFVSVDAHVESADRQERRRSSSRSAARALSASSRRRRPRSSSGGGASRFVELGGGAVASSATRAALADAGLHPAARDVGGRSLGARGRQRSAARPRRGGVPSAVRAARAALRRGRGRQRARCGRRRARGGRHPCRGGRGRGVWPSLVPGDGSRRARDRRDRRRRSTAIASAPRSATGSPPRTRFPQARRRRRSRTRRDSGPPCGSTGAGRSSPSAAAPRSTSPASPPRRTFAASPGCRCRRRFSRRSTRRSAARPRSTSPRGRTSSGTFHWPARVIVDPELLATLPEAERENGLAEVVKTGLLAGEPVWELPTAEQVRRCAAFKAAVCLRDPTIAARDAAQPRPHVRPCARGGLGLLAPAWTGRRARSRRRLSAVRARETRRGSSRSSSTLSSRRSTARPPGQRSRATRRRSRDARVSSCSTRPDSPGSASRWTTQRCERRSTRSSPDPGQPVLRSAAAIPVIERRSGRRSASRSAGRRLRIPKAPEELDLDRVHRIDVRVAERDRALDDRLPVEQLARPHDREHRGDRTLVLGCDQIEDAVALGAGLDELEVALGDVEARLRKGHLEIGDQRAEERERAVEAPELASARGCKRSATPEPGGKHAAILRPREDPRDRA